MRDHVAIHELAVVLRCSPGEAVDRLREAGVADTGATPGRKYDRVAAVRAVTRLAAAGKLEPLAPEVLIGFVCGYLTVSASPVYAGRLPRLEDLLRGLVALQRERLSASPAFGCTDAHRREL